MRNLVHPFYVIPEEEGLETDPRRGGRLVVRLPEIELDDRGFQELVSEARTRIVRRCPEWTEHNVSDPGITLIELFAWMTEMTTYRLNRVPDKIYVRLLELLGVPMSPATPARTRVRFMLAATPEEPITLAAGETEVGTVRTAYEESVVFEVAETRTIEPLRAVRLRRRPRRRAAQHRRRRRASRARSAPTARRSPRSPSPATRCTSASTSRSRACSCASPSRPSPRAAPASTRAARRCAGRCPPASSPAATSSGSPSTVLEDTTGGFNFGSGDVLLECVGDSERVPFGGHRLHWLRCRVATPEEAGGAAYERPPEVFTITGEPVGAILMCQHAEHVDNEVLGESDGTPGPVVHRPAPADARAVRRRVARGARPADRRLGALGPRRRRSTSAAPTTASTSATPAHGTIELGPAVRQADGDWRYYGAVPPKGATLRMSRYRTGGGLRGNVLPGTLTVLKSGPPGIASVTNPAGARGGVDPEGLDTVRLRGAMELRSRHRAVTAEDFEYLAGEASPRVARAVCVPPDEGNAVAVRILPYLHPADRRLDFDELQPTRELLDEVASHLDERRLLGATVHVAPVRLRGVSVVVELQTEPLADLVRIREETLRELYRFLNPLVGGTPGRHGRRAGSSAAR